MGLNNIVRSKGYKNFMSKLYGIGAAVVILGALFKILHLPLANQMLIAGMGTEAIIFFFSAFEPLHVEYDWSIVYPELAGMDHGTKVIKKEKALTGTVTQQLDKMLSEAKIGPDLIQSLGRGLQNLSESASQLSVTTSAAAATDKFINNINSASESVVDLTAAYRKTAESVNKDLNLSEDYLASVKDATNAVSSLASIYKETASTLSSGETSYTQELKKMAGSLSSINALYELQLQNSTSQLESTKEVQERIQTLVANFADSAEGVLKYKEQVDALSKKVAELNNVYGNMLAAMQTRI